jgi:phage shock protein A
MKNYYDQQQELQTALYRLETLKEKKKLLFNKTQPGTMDYSKEPVEGGVHKDLMTEYVIKIEKIDKEIEEKEKEIELLSKYLKKMEKCLRTMKGTLEQIFVAKYIDRLPVREIMIKVNYCQSDVYRKLQVIKKILNEDSMME